MSFWVFFMLWMMDQKNISTPQTMCCVVCYFSHNVPIQHRTCGKPRMISYDKNNGTKTLNYTCLKTPQARTFQMDY